MIVKPNAAASSFDFVHPNCMVFTAHGRLFVGDSRGQIAVWDVALRQGNIYADNHFVIKHKELEGDEINQLIVHPEHENKLFVYSRDNCIRLVEYESMKGPRVRKRFFGIRCRDLSVRSCVSPDGQYLVGGSEDGVPCLWSATTGEAFSQKQTKRYECRFLDMVSDVAWNPKYNMFALTGFGHNFPAMVYVYERSEEQLNEIFYSNAGGTTAASSVDVSAAVEGKGTARGKEPEV